MDEKLDYALKFLNAYLEIVIKNSYKCQHCEMYNEKNNSCFLASDCIANDFLYYTEGD